jgi:hypothetical protein
VLRYSKVWAPSARELVALENQIRDMTQQLSSQRQQWSSIMANASWPHGQSKHSATPSAPALPAQASMDGLHLPLECPVRNVADVQAKLESLQHEAERVIGYAIALQQHERPAHG